MSGEARTRKSLHNFGHTDITNLSLHYMKSKDILLVMDRLNNNILFTEVKTLNGNNKLIFQIRVSHYMILEVFYFYRTSLLSLVL
jgi:hypothetical protein